MGVPLASIRSTSGSATTSASTSPLGIITLTMVGPLLMPLTALEMALTVAAEICSICRPRSPRAGGSRRNEAW